MNSFRYLERGVEAEIARQRGIVEAGGQVEQETLHFDPVSGSLTPLRSKEYAHDYRYFPEPDLVPLVPSDADVEAARASPARASRAASRALRRRARPQPRTPPGCSPSTPISPPSSSRATAAAGDGVEPTAIANWVTGDLVAIAREADAEPAATAATPEAVAALVGLVVRQGGQPGRRPRGAGRARRARAANPPRSSSGSTSAPATPGSSRRSSSGRSKQQPDAAEKVRAGEGKAIGAIVGAVMKETRGRADGGEVTSLIREPSSASDSCASATL